MSEQSQPFPLGPPANEFDHRILDAMSTPVSDVAPEVQAFVQLTNDLLQLDPFIIGAGGEPITDQVWAEVLPAREGIERWLAVLLGARTAAEEVRRLRGLQGPEQSN